MIKRRAFLTSLSLAAASAAAEIRPDGGLIRGGRILQFSLPSPPPFSPESISGLTLWLKADALALSDADPVASWTDSSGLGNHAVQADAGKKPTYKTAILNGKAVVRFDGGDGLVTGALLSRTFFAVVNHSDGATFSGFRRVWSANNVNALIGNQSTSDYTFSGGTDIMVNGAVTASALTLASFKVVSLVHTAQANEVVDVGSLGGSSQFLAGDIAELIAYDSALSSGNRLLVTQYLGAKYGITVQ